MPGKDMSPPIIQPFGVVIFDLDGTLIDSAPDMTRVINRTLAQFGRSTITEDAVRTMIGDGSASLVRDAFAATGEGHSSALLDQALVHYLDSYFADDGALRPYDGAEKTLRGLVAGGAKIGLCTNKQERIARKILDRLGWSDLFSGIAGGDSFPWKKPDGRHLAGVREQMGGLNVPAAMVGDNGNDVRAARECEMPVVVFSHGYPRMPLADLRADLIIDHFAELGSALCRI